MTGSCRFGKANWKRPHRLLGVSRQAVGWWLPAVGWQAELAGRDLALRLLKATI